MKEQEQPATSFSLADGFPEVDHDPTFKAELKCHICNCVNCWILDHDCVCIMLDDIVRLFAQL